MLKPKSLEYLKRNIYLLIIPFILVALVSYNYMHFPVPKGEEFYIILTRIMILWFVLSWLLIYRNAWTRFVELSNLAILTFSYVAAKFDTIYNHILLGEGEGLGVTTIWTPLFILFFFFALKKKWGFLYSMGIFIIVLAFGLSNLASLTTDQIFSLSQYYVSYIVYVVIFYFAQHLIKQFAEMETIKKNALVDYLTGIANRQQIDKWLENRIAVSMKEDTPLSIIFFDIDHFKKVNDTFGHKIGDSVLIELTDLINNSLEDSDLFGRWGGEEFILVTNNSIENAKIKAEQLRLKVKEHHFKIAGKQTASFGVTEYQQGETVDAVLNRVDKCLYKSKQGGRDQVTMI